VNGIRPCSVGDGEYPTVRGGPFPFDVEVVVTSNFGPRERLSTSIGTTGPFHYGTDFWRAEPPPLVALTAGTVRIAQADHPEVGNWLRVDAGDGWTWDYYHMADPPFVRAGDVLRAGDAVGVVGATGLSTGPHLHLGMAHNGINLDPLAELRLAPNVPLPQGEVYPEEGDVDVIKLSQADALPAVLGALAGIAGAVGQQDGQWIGVSASAPAGYRDIVIRVKG
jgi:hypothetical protein